MAYPTLTDYIQAVRDYPHISILDSVLKGGTPVRGPNSLRVYSGGFSCVFPFEVGSNTFALRCWRRDIGGAEIRYQEISSYLKQRNLPYFVEFEYIPEGILVNGTRWPTTRMEWAEGETLCEFVKSNIHDPGVLRTAAAEFLKMAETLHNHQMSHGDLQDGNILLRKSGTDVDIKLIDYDSMFVPALRAQPDSVIVGLPEYQHPQRQSGAKGANEKIDYFSELVIYLSLLSLAEKPDLWNQFGGRKEKALLFVADDFTNPIQSNVFRQLDNLSPDVKLLASKLKEFCAIPSIDQLDPLESLVPRSDPIAKTAYDQGIAFLRSKRYNEAITEFEKAVGIDSKFKEAHHGLGISYLQMGNLNEAEKAVKAALKIDANYQDARKLLDVIKQKQRAIGSNPIGSGPSPSPPPPNPPNPTLVGTSNGRSLRRHYFYRGLVVVGVICSVFLLVLNSKNADIRELKGQLSEIESQFAPLEYDNNWLQKKNTGLLNEKQELQKKLSEKDTQLISLKDENQKLRGKRQTMPRENHETQQSITGYGEKLASLSKKNQELQNANRTLNNQKQELENQLTQRDEDLNSLTEKYQAMQIENTRLLRQNRDLQDLRAYVPQEPELPKGEREISSKVEILKGHTQWVRSLAFSPDGKTLASASRDNTIRLWNVVTRKHQLTLRGHLNWVISVAFSPDGRKLASGGGSGDKTIRLWDVASGTTEQTLTGHGNWVSSVAFSPDGRTLASGSGDKTIRLWDVGTGTHEQTLTGHTNWISSIAFSPDGATLASVSSDKTIRLWNVGTGTHKRILWEHTHYITSVAFSPDGIMLGSGSGDGTIRLWDASTRTHKRTLRGHTGWVRSVAFSPDGQTIASGSEDTTIRLWNAVTGTHKRTFSGHTDSVVSVAFSPDGKTLASASADKTIRLWR